MITLYAMVVKGIGLADCAVFDVTGVRRYYIIGSWVVRASGVLLSKIRLFSFLSGGCVIENSGDYGKPEDKG